MSSFLHQVIPYLRNAGAPNVCEFLTALEDVIELGDRFVIRLGGMTALATGDDLLAGPRGIGVAGTALMIPFDAHLLVRDRLPEHFHMPVQPPSAFRRTAFGYVSGPDRTFGMISRDDEIEPGRHFREALTDAVGNIKKMAALHGRSAAMAVYRGREVHVGTGVTIDETGFGSPTLQDLVRWSDVRMFDIGERVRLTLDGMTVEVFDDMTVEEPA